MNKKILSRVCFLLSLVFIIPLGVSAAGRDAQDAEPVDMETLLAGIPSDAYGGVYINENGQIVVNIVNGKEIAYAQNMTLDDSQNVIYNHVDISMESLEVVHDALIPYMNQYGIVTIDANEVTNSLDIEVYARNEDLVDFLQNYIDLKHVNITVLPEGHTIQASVATEPPTTNFSEEYTNNNARLGSPPLSRGMYPHRNR